MTHEEMAVACLELAVDGVLARESVEVRATVFDGFVDGDTVRLGCLRLAMKKEGQQARISADAVVDYAKKYLAFVRPPAPKPAKKKRGRPRKN